jgi:hypothetical protein
MNVIRKTTYNDESNFRQIAIEEQKARDICARKIRDRGLSMKLVDVEYTFDRHKIIFYFTAAERVDFRQLVRDLAQELKTRIELRHIQVRDEAKLVGGIGVCGRELCCATWLREFKPISMKMAKRQNLSLNPSKISGQCGRLLCCLGYENELYRGRKKKPVAPPPEVEAPLTPREEIDSEVAPDLDELSDEEWVAQVEAAEIAAFNELGEVVSAPLEDDRGAQPSAVVEIGFGHGQRPRKHGPSEPASSPESRPEEKQQTNQAGPSNAARHPRSRRRRGGRGRRRRKNKGSRTPRSGS